MPFIQQDNREYDLAVTMSRQLFKVIAAVKTIKNYLPKNWAKYMNLIIKKHGAEEVQETLDWYCANMTREFVPKVASTRYFREKYDAIREAMTRDGVDVKVSKEAQEFADKLLLELPFPVEVRAKLPELVESSRAGIHRMVWIIAALVANDNYWEGSRHDNHLVFINTVVTHRLKVMLTVWFTDMSNRLWRPHYDGDVMKLAFRMDSEAFRVKYWQDWSFNWCGKGTAYNDLLATLIEESKK